MILINISAIIVYNQKKFIDVLTQLIKFNLDLDFKSER